MINNNPYLMKKIAILLTLLFCISPSFAQDTGYDDVKKTNVQATRQGFGDFRGLDFSLGFVNPRMTTEGSAYYFNHWDTEGIIYIKDKGRVKIKNVNINLYDNKLIALYDENKVFTFDSDNLIKIIIDDKIFRTFKIGNELKIFELFFNDKLSIYKYYSLSYSKGSVNPMLNRKANKYIKKEKYYLYKDKELNQMKLTRKSVSKMLESDTVSQEEILGYIKQNKLSLNEEADLTQLLKFLSNKQ